jgi:hypothetical protein
LQGISIDWSLSPLQVYHKRSTVVSEGEEHTQDSNLQHTHAHKPRLELETHHREFTTQTELKSLTQSIKCVEAESGSLRMLSECFVYCSMRLGVPFIALRQLGAVGDQLGRQFLPSVEWCTEQSGAPPDNYCSSPVRDPFLFWQSRPLDLRICWHTGQSGAIIRPLAKPRVARLSRRRPLAVSAVGSPDSPVHLRTV